MSEEADQITLMANIASLPLANLALPHRYEFRETRLQDTQELANLYFAAYPRLIVETEVAALEEIQVTFKGEYGDLDLSASPLVTTAGMIAAAILTVKEAPWDDTPPGPFLIEVIVHPDHRRRGLARAAVLQASSTLLAKGEQTVALRVMSDNEAALKLYRGLGFRRWEI